MTPDWSQALANETGLSSIGPVSEGPLVRTALLVLADDPQHCEVLEALVSSPAPERYSGVIETTAVLSAVLFVLGTPCQARARQGRAVGLQAREETHGRDAAQVVDEKPIGIHHQAGGVASHDERHGQRSAR
jgi:hypothetical protein